MVGLLLAGSWTSRGSCRTLEQPRWPLAAQVEGPWQGADVLRAFRQVQQRSDERAADHADRPRGYMYTYNDMSSDCAVRAIIMTPVSVPGLSNKRCSTGLSRRDWRPQYSLKAAVTCMHVRISVDVCMYVCHVCSHVHVLDSVLRAHCHCLTVAVALLITHDCIIGAARIECTLLG